MEPTEADNHRKREYILVKHGLKFYYCRAERHDPDVYKVMANVGEKEGRMIIERANKSSDFNTMVDAVYDRDALEEKLSVEEPVAKTKKKSAAQRRLEELEAELGVVRDMPR